MKDYIRERTLNAARYTLKHKCTIRETAKQMKVSKSTIHIDLTERLPKINPVIALAVRKVILTNKSERHIRGGEATKLLYGRRDQRVHSKYIPNQNMFDDKQLNEGIRRFENAERKGM